MGKFVISTHGRLQDWVALENGYFEDEGLDCSLDVKVLENADQSIEVDEPADVRVGAYELYRSGSGGKKDMSCACHWVVAQAAGDGAGHMWGQAYSVLPSGIYVTGRSPVRQPGDLAGVKVAVGYHSGSHFATIQALEVYLSKEQICLSFVGMPYDRVDRLLEGSVAAAALWGAPTYIAEQLGCRKVLDSTFMAGFMFSADIDVLDVEAYLRALKRAQLELDLAPERYKHHYSKEIPDRYRDRVDVGCFGTGERLVFLPYTKESYDRAQAWMRERGLFEAGGASTRYESAVRV
ncbi:MAG: ABC transporter substrate-binding protein [Acidimicrobiales bacterium]